jgi:hypothetical protein
VVRRRSEISDSSASQKITITPRQEYLQGLVICVAAAGIVL